MAANPYKFNVATQSGCLSKGNAQIGVEDINYGSTALTDFWAGFSPPSGGYTWYKDAGIGNGAFIRTAANDQTLVNIVNEEFSQGFTSATQAITYINTNSGWLIMNRDYPDIPTSGLTLIVDAGLVCSYPKSGNLLSIDSYSKKSATQYLQNGALYTSSSGGGVIYDGVDDLSYFDDSDGVYFGVPLSAAFTTIHILQSTDLNWFNNGGGLNNLYNDGSGFIIYPLVGTKQTQLFVGDVGSHFSVLVGTHTATNIQVPLFYAVSSNATNSHKGYFGGTASIYTSTTSITRANTNHELFIARHGYTAAYQKMTSYIVLYYNRQLSDAEVNKIYLAYAPRFGW